MHIKSFHFNAANLSAILIAVCMAGCAWNTEKRLQDASVAMESGEFDQARSIYQSVLSYQPEQPDAIAGMVALAEARNATAEIRKWSRELIKYRPWDRNANLAVGKDALEQGDLNEAVVRFMLAFQNSEYQNDKKEAMLLLDSVRFAIMERQELKLQEALEESKPESPK